MPKSDWKYAQEAIGRAQSPDVTRPPPRPWRGLPFRRQVKRSGRSPADNFPNRAGACSPAPRQPKEPLSISNDLAQLEAAQNEKRLHVTQSPQRGPLDDFSTVSDRSSQFKGRESIKKLKSALRDKLLGLSTMHGKEEKRRSGAKVPGKANSPIESFSSIAAPHSRPQSRARCPLTPPRSISGDLHALGRATLARPKEVWQPDSGPPATRVTMASPTPDSKPHRRTRVKPHMMVEVDDEGEHEMVAPSPRATSPMPENAAHRERAASPRPGNFSTPSNSSTPNRLMSKEKESPVSNWKTMTFAGSRDSPDSTVSTVTSDDKQGKPITPSSRDKKIGRIRKERVAMAKLKEEEELMGERLHTKRGGMSVPFKTHGEKDEEEVAERLVLASLMAPGMRNELSQRIERDRKRYSLSGGKLEGEKHAELWSLSKSMNIPLQDIKVARDIFDKFDTDESGDINEEEFTRLVSQMTLSENGDAMPEDLTSFSKFFNQQESINFQDFVSWYSSHGFSENVTLDKEQREIREIARRYGLPLVEVESTKRTFDGFDTDGSGQIDVEEFTKLLYKLVKVPPSLELPASRIKAFWTEIDADGSGEVNFEEFLVWYKRYFDMSGKKARSNSSPIEWFYKSVRTLTPG